MSTHTGDPNVFKCGCPQDCPDICAMVYTVDSGRWYRCTVRPNISRAARLCVKLKDFAKHHYNPNRLIHSQRRVGSKGSAQDEPPGVRKAHGRSRLVVCFAGCGLPLRELPR